MRRALLTSLVAAALVPLAGCASAGAGVCGPGQGRMAIDQLYFGRNVGDVVGVSEADFARFIDEEITPRFPDGLTVIDGAGQYRGKDGRLVREPSKIVVLVVTPGAEASAKIEAIRAAYKMRFHQESVLLVAQPACAAF